MVALMTAVPITILLLCVAVIVTAFLYFVTEAKKKVRNEKISSIIKREDSVKIICDGIAKFADDFSGLFEPTYKLSLGNVEGADALVEEWKNRAVMLGQSHDFALVISEICSGSEWWDDKKFISFASDLISALLKNGFSRSETPPHRWSIGGYIVE
ncbi:MAG: hypothetical protein IJF55_01235 [Clostridia bacterium]|jgi:hypothetical protein|nr:hypothetical protein [Clostridia bacterium]